MNKNHQKKVENCVKQYRLQVNKCVEPSRKHS